MMAAEKENGESKIQVYKKALEHLPAEAQLWK